MTDFYDWSTSASDNANADETINFAEFQTPSSVNDSMRAVLARVAEFRNDLGPTRSSTGTGNAYAVTSVAGGSATYRDGEIVCFVVDRGNTSAATLNVNSRGAKAFRPASGVEFSTGELRTNQPVIAFYRQASEEWLAVNTGYHVTAMTAGALTQSIAGRLITVGTPVLSLAPSPATGYIRLTETTQTVNKATWPELSAWLAALSSPYPWGSTSTTFNLPPAAGYFLRFAPTSTTIDPGGARLAGATQTDLVKAHTHTATTGSAGAHEHTYTRYGDTTVGGSGGTTANRGASTQTTSSAAAHTHTVTVDANVGAENRPVNVAMHLDVFASSTLAAGTLGMFGFPYAWDTGTTDADPGLARVRVNNATVGSATKLFVSDTDAWGMDLTTLLGTVVAGTIIRLSKIGGQNNGLVLTATGAATDDGDYLDIPVSVTAISGSFAASDSLALEFWGAAGAGGSTNLSYVPAPTIGTVTSDTGTSATLSLADGTNAGLMAPAQHTKLDGIEAGAEVNPTGAEIVAAIDTELGSTTWQGGGGGGGANIATDVIWNAKGDLAVGTGADAASRLAVGTNGQVLVADSAEATGTKWTSALDLSGSSGLPVSGISASTSTALGVGSVELGHATDTTVARLSAGVLGVEGKTVATLSTQQSWTAQQTSTIATLTDGANVAWDVSTQQKAKVTLGGNRTMDATTNAVEGTTYLLWVIQDGTGTRVPSWTTTGAGSFDFGTDGAPTLTTTASKADLLAFEAISIGGTLKLRFAGIKKGFT